MLKLYFSRRLCPRLLLPALLAATQISAGTTEPDRAYSPDIHIDREGITIADEDAAAGTGGNTALVFLGFLPGTADLDALHGLPNGDLLFSLETDATLGGNFYRDCDIIRFDGDNWSKELDCMAQGLPVNVDVDAVAAAGEDLLLSIDVDADIAGFLYSDADVILFDGNAFSKFTDASAIGIDPSLDVDAIHVDLEGRMLFSFDTPGELDGIPFQDEDVMAWNSPGWSLEHDGSAQTLALIPADIDAWSYVIVNGDLIFRDGFE